MDIIALWQSEPTSALGINNDLGDCVCARWQLLSAALGGRLSS